MASLAKNKPLLSSARIAVSILTCSELSTREALRERGAFALFADWSMRVLLYSVIAAGSKLFLSSQL
jgi:hypothetical protein